jgi:dihydropteroate synthase
MTRIMGILNVTPDSFSDAGRYLDPSAAIARAREMEREGAYIIDIGGESTRPGSQRVTPDQELARLMPVLECLKGQIRIPFSIDTLNLDVAEKAVECGAAYINHIVIDKSRTLEMAELARSAGINLILVYARGPLEAMHRRPAAPDPIGETRDALAALRDLAVGAGLPQDRLLLDPGIGFGTQPEESYALLRNLPVLQGLGCRLVVGTSRKRFLASHGDLPEARDFATAATVAMLASMQCDIVRVHNVRAMSQIVQVVERIQAQEQVVR